MPETEKKAPRVINKSGTLKMDDKTAATRQVRDIGGRRMERRNRRDRVRADAGQKEFDDITISVDRVSRTVAGGRRMRFKALVAIGNHKNKVGIGVAKGNDVTTAVAKATRKAKKAMITFSMDGETICHETRTKVTGADVLMKPAAPGTGIIAGGTVRAIMGLTGVKNLISKSLGSTNKVNIAYAVIEGLRNQVPREQWVTTRAKAKTETKKEATSKIQKGAAAKVKKETASEAKKETAPKAKKETAPEAKKETAPKAKKETAPEAKKETISKAKKETAAKSESGVKKEAKPAKKTTAKEGK